MIDLASRYIAHLSEQGADIIIPSVVLGELLMGSPPNIADTLRTSFGKHLRIPPYDIVAAMHFGRIWKTKASDDMIERIKSDHNARRRELKADTMIIAIALASKADKIVSNDGALREMASGFIEAIDIPNVGIQPNLPNLL